jgi:hypothetical protein
VNETGEKLCAPLLVYGLYLPNTDFTTEVIAPEYKNDSKISKPVLLNSSFLE